MRDKEIITCRLFLFLIVYFKKQTYATYNSMKIIHEAQMEGYVVWCKNSAILV